MNNWKYFKQASGSNLRVRRITWNVMSNADSYSADLARADELCKEQGLSLTPVRRKVLELLLESDGPVKAYDLLSMLKPGGNAQPPTVYRALDFLANAGLIHKVEALNAYMACVHSHDDGGAELYICETCGRVQEKHIHTSPTEGPDAFLISRSVIEHYGACGNCRKGQTQ